MMADDMAQGARGIILLERSASGGKGEDAATPADGVLEDVLEELRSAVEGTSRESSGAVACTSSSGVQIR